MTTSGKNVRTMLWNQSMQKDLNSKQKKDLADEHVEVADKSLARALDCARAAIDKKAENLKILDVSKISGFTDYFVICSALTDRQVEAIANAVERELRNKKVKILNSEGRTDHRWVLLDFGDVIVHIFLDALRDYYRLEELWSSARPVSVPSEFYGPGVKRLN